MNLDEMKKLYESEPDKWVVYDKIVYQDKRIEYKKVYEFSGSIQNSMIPIHKNHETIADAVIANPNVEIQYRWHEENWMGAKGSFFEYCDIHCSYQLKPQKQNFNGGYIKASQEARNLLEADSKAMKFNYQTIPDSDVHFLVSEDGLGFMKVNKDQLYDDQKQFYINNGALSWDEPKAEYCKEGKNLYCGVCEFCEKEDRPKQINNIEDLNELPLAEEHIPDIGKKEKPNEQLGHNPNSLDDNVSIDADGVNRIEVIGKDGREFSKILKDSTYKVSIQDDGRTIKLFEKLIKPKEPTLREILEDIKYHKISIDAGSLLIKAQFKISEE